MAAAGSRCPRISSGNGSCTICRMRKSTVRCVPQDLRPIGEESSERYEYIPAQLMVVEDVCKKYACDCTVKTATKPPQPIEKSTAGASLLAEVIVAKTADHLPLHRQEKIFERHGVEISRKTMGGWMGQVRRSAEAAVWGRQGSAVPVQGDRDRRHGREGARRETAVRTHGTDLAVPRGSGASGDRFTITPRRGSALGRRSFWRDIAVTYRWMPMADTMPFSRTRRAD